MTVSTNSKAYRGRMTPGIKPGDVIGDTQRFFKRGSREYRRVSFAFFAAGLATFAILYCVQPLFPVYSSKFHVSPATASLSLSVTTILLALTLPVAGVLSDAIGRKPIMTVSLGLSTICCILTAVSPGFTSLIWIRAVQGIVLAGLPAVAMAYLSEEMEAGSLGFAMGLYISGNTIGGLMGRIVVSLVTDASSWRIGIAVLATISMIASIFFWRNLPPSRHFRAQKVDPDNLLRAFGRQFRDPGLVCLYLVGAFLMGGFVTLYNYMGYRLIAAPYHLSQSVVGLIFVVYLAGTFSSSWMGRVADRVGRRKVLWLNVIIMGIGVLLTLAPNLVVIILGIVVFTFGFFGGHSTASSWVGRRAISGKGQASALYLLFYYVGSSLGGSAGGLFWSNDQWVGIVSMICGLLLLALVASLILSLIPPINQIQEQ